MIRDSIFLQIKNLSFIECLTKLTYISRKVYELHGNEISSGTILFFPLGACGIASDFFGTWLIEEVRLQNVSVIKGDRKILDHNHFVTVTHNWLKVDDFIVDYTSDQFSDGVDPVFVGYYSIFHNSFNVSSGGTPSIGDVPIQGRYEEYTQYMTLEIEKMFS